MKKRHTVDENDPISALWRSWRAFLLGGLCGILLASGFALKRQHSYFYQAELRAADLEAQVSALTRVDLPALNWQLRRHLWELQDYVPNIYSTRSRDFNADQDN